MQNLSKLFAIQTYFCLLDKPANKSYRAKWSWFAWHAIFSCGVSKIISITVVAISSDIEFTSNLLLSRQITIKITCF